MYLYIYIKVMDFDQKRTRQRQGYSAYQELFLVACSSSFVLPPPAEHIGFVNTVSQEIDGFLEGKNICIKERRKRSTARQPHLYIITRHYTIVATTTPTLSTHLFHRSPNDGRTERRKEGWHGKERRHDEKEGQQERRQERAGTWSSLFLSFKAKFSFPRASIGA